MKELWSQALASIGARVTRENFSTYFQPLRFVSVSGDQIHLEVGDPFFGDWVREHYQDLLDEAVTQAAAQPMHVVLDVAAGAVTPDVERTPRYVEPRIPELRGPIWNSFPLNPHYTFERFIVGPNSEMAHAASLAVAREPARTFNPLFIYGGTGLGKTHLLHAIAHRVKELTPATRITYVSAEEFTNQMIKSISHQQMDAFRERYRTQCDVLLMDDVHVLEGKERTQEEFFHTFNALHGAQKQIVLTSDKMPMELRQLEERLRSRFNWGMLTDIKPPQFETRVAILRGKAEREGVPISDEVAFHLAKLITSNVRELEGALTRLVAFASIKGKPLSIALADEALGELVDVRARAVTMDSVVKLVAEHFDLKVADLKGARRHRVVAHPRSLAMYLCRKHTQASFPQIGRGFGGRDHSTVISAIRKIEDSLDSDTALRAEMDALERKLPT